MRSRIASFAAASLAALTPLAAHAQQTPVAILGASESLREDIEALLPDRAPPETLFDAERLSEEAARIALSYLRSEGHYAATVAPVALDEPPRAQIEIELGPRYVYAPAAVVYDGAPPSVSAQESVSALISALAPGAPARAGDVLAAEARSVEALRAQGYPLAHAGERRVIVDHAARTLEAHFRLDAGASVRLGAVRAAPEGVVHDDIVQRFADWTPGDAYTPDHIARLRRAASSTGVFSSVSATIAETPDAQGRSDVTLALEPRLPRSLELGAGYSTTDGAGVEAEWTRRNRWRRAETLSIQAQAAELRTGLDATLSFPFSDDEDRTTIWSAGAAHENTEAYSKDGFYIGWSRNARPRERYSLSYGAQFSADSYSEAAGVDNALVLSTFVAARRDTTNDPLDARHGDVIDLRVEPSISTGDRTTGFVRAVADARAYKSVRRDSNLTFASRARLGWIEPVAGNVSDLPLDRLFYAGGGGSVRGYAYNAIYPEDMTGSLEPPGGRGLFETSLEARMRFGQRWGGALFLDGGSAFNDVEDATDFRWGAGFGVRYELGFAPLRIDFAAPLDARDDDEDFAVYVSIGQAF